MEREKNVLRLHLVNVDDVCEAGEQQQQQVDVLLLKTRSKKLHTAADHRLQVVDLLLQDEGGEDVLAGLHCHRHHIVARVMKTREEKRVQLCWGKDTVYVFGKGEKKEDGT